MQSIPSHWRLLRDHGAIQFWHDPRTGQVLKTCSMSAEDWKAEQARKREAFIGARRTHDKHDMEHLGTLPAAMFQNALTEGWIRDPKYVHETLEANPDLKLTDRRII